MGDTIQFYYNKSFAYSTVILLGILLAIFVFRTFQFSGEQFLIIFSFDCFFALIILFVIVKYLFPAIRKKAALELNNRAIIDLIRRRVVGWGNVRSVRLIRLYGVFTPGIAVDLEDKKIFLKGLNTFQKLIAAIADLSYKTPFIIPLQYISGDIKEIFKTVDDYLHRFKNSA